MINSEIFDSEDLKSPVIYITPRSTRIFGNDCEKKVKSPENNEKTNKLVEYNENAESEIVIDIRTNRENNRKKNRSYCTRQSILRKRAFLLLLGFLYFVSVDHVHHYVYFPIIMFGVSFVIFYNFPFLVYCSNSKPLYYEDLFIDTSKLPLLDLDYKIRKKFVNSFEVTLVFTNSLLLAALSDYWIYKTEDHQSFIQIAGITGGILQLFQIINNILGSLLLSFFSSKIHKTIQLQQEKKEKKEKKKKKINEKISGKQVKQTNENIRLHHTKHKVYETKHSISVRKPYNYIVERFQLPVKNKNIDKTNKSTSKILEKINYNKDLISNKDSKNISFSLQDQVLRVQENKKIKRNQKLVDENPFQRVGRELKDSPHPLKHVNNDANNHTNNHANNHANNDSNHTK